MQTEHSIRRPVAARRALEQRQKMLALGILLALGIAGVLALLLVSCGSGSITAVSPRTESCAGRREFRKCRYGCGRSGQSGIRAGSISHTKRASYFAWEFWTDVGRE